MHDATITPFISQTLILPLSEIDKSQISIKKPCSFLLLFDGTNLSTLLACSVCVVDFDWPSESSNSLDSNNGILPCIVEKMYGYSTRHPCGTLV